jgi:putative flavoprotein involved in K+ transport
MTSTGELGSRCVVIASGACNLPSVPALRAALPPSIGSSPRSTIASRVISRGRRAGGGPVGHRPAARLRDSPVRPPVTISVGEHVRLPRTYRGRDVLWWMDRSGVWNQRYDEIDDLTRARRLPSPQLVGTPERTTLDLNALGTMGIQIVGRLSTVRDGRALFSGGLRNLFALADLKMERLLDTFDAVGRDPRARRGRGRARALRADRVPESSPLQLDLRDGRIRSVVWATGYRPDYRWLEVPVLDDKGHLRHDGGVVESPGSTRSACRCCGAASPPSFTASRTTPATSSTHLSRLSVRVRSRPRAGRR